MKKLLVIFPLLLVCFALKAQSRVSFKIKNTKGKPLPNLEVVAYNEAADDRLTEITDESGKVTFILSQVGVYTFSYLGETDFDTYEVRSGFTGKASRTITYDPKGIFAHAPKADRSGLQFSSCSPMKFKDQPNTMALTVRLVTQKKIRLPDVEIFLVSISDKFKMRAVTNSSGEAIFFVPINSSFEVDADGNEALQVVETTNMPGKNVTHLVFYEKLNIIEIAKGDTLIQENITQTNGTNTHLLFKLKLINYKGVPLEGEPVYLQVENSTKVYESVTDARGLCKFMIPKNTNYILNLTYEQGLHFTEANSATGFGTEFLTRSYRGSAEIERIIAEQEAQMVRMREREELEKQRLLDMEEARKKRLELMKLGQKERDSLMKLEEQKRMVDLRKMEKKLVKSFYEEKLVPSFRSTPVKSATPPSDYAIPNSTGFTIQFKSSKALGTPTLVGDNMFLPASYYSPNFYCLNAKTGAYKWGVALGESGISPAVYSNGVLLINTYSCTLYALDAETGALLWSKWLAGTIHSTPSADGKHVYVVFRYGGAYVLSCFDLKTGDFKWINRVDSETIACPVVEGNQVHVASTSGLYYIFNKTTGKPIEIIPGIKALSSPTITGRSIFLTATIQAKDRLVEIDRATYKVKKEYEIELNPVRIYGSAQNMMNFNGSHPIVYKNQYVVLLDEKGLKVFDAKSEQVLWEEDVAVATCQVPIVANNKIYLGTLKGELLIYDIAKGTSIQAQNLSVPIDGQPVYNNGFLYLSTEGLLNAIRFSKNFQWNQWNLNASHNLKVN